MTALHKQNFCSTVFEVTSFGGCPSISHNINFLSLYNGVVMVVNVLKCFSNLFNPGDRNLIKQRHIDVANVVTMGPVFFFFFLVMAVTKCKGHPNEKDRPPLAMVFYYTMSGRVPTCINAFDAFDSSSLKQQCLLHHCPHNPVTGKLFCTVSLCSGINFIQLDQQRCLENRPNILCNIHHWKQQTYVRCLIFL